MNATASHNSEVQVQSAGTRRTVRYVAAAMSAVVAILYVVLMLLVRNAELEPGATDTTTYAGYLGLAVAYGIGAGVRVGSALRVGVDVSHERRVSPVANRRYDGMKAGGTLTYGY